MILHIKYVGGSLVQKKQQLDLLMQRNRAVRLTRNLMLYSPIDVYMKTCERTALKVLNDECHPLHKFMNFLPHGRVG